MIYLIHIMKSSALKKLYKEYYALDNASLNELAQKNFNTFKIGIGILALFGFGNLISYMSVNRHDLKSVLPYLIYFGGYALTAVVTSAYCLIIRNCRKRLSYIMKMLPFYITSIAVYLLALYNFFILGNRLNGVISYEIACVSVLLFFDFDPFLYLWVPFIPYVAMQPTLFREFPLSTVGDIFVLTLIMCLVSFRKRRLIKRNFDLANKLKERVQIITFGNFTILHNKVVVKFQRKKSLELLAYLVYKNGTSVDSQELMAVLWGDSATSDRYGSSLRNLIVDIKQTLKKLEINDLFVAEYNSFRINPAAADCDYYNFLNGDEKAHKTFTGEFMSQFSWAEDVAAFLESR